MKIGECQLCKLQKELLSKSHIIPEFNYNILYDDKNFIKKIFLTAIEGIKYVGNVAKGEYERSILCVECDSIRIKASEDYVSRLIYAKNPLEVDQQPNCTNYVNQEGQEFSICTNVDYDRVKRYILSILWRASISSRPFFDGIEMEDPMMEEMRQVILNASNTNFSKWPILITSWLNDPNARRDIIMQPKTYIETIGHRYCFPIRGVIFNIYTNIEDVPVLIRDFLLRPNELPMLHLQRGDYLNYIRVYNGGVR